MSYNLSIYDIAIRYTLMAIVTILGALTGMYWMMIIGVILFLSAILGMCPIYSMLGINNAKNAGKDYQ